MENILMSNDFSEFMTTEQIFQAWGEISDSLFTLKEAVNNRLEEIGFDEDEYDEDTAGEECNKLVDLLNTLEDMDI